MEHDLRTSEGVAAFMRESTSAKDWSNRAAAVKKANGGGYPPFWYATAISSGLCEQVHNGFGEVGVLETEVVSAEEAKKLFG